MFIDSFTSNLNKSLRKVEKLIENRNIGKIFRNIQNNNILSSSCLQCIILWLIFYGKIRIKAS